MIFKTTFLYLLGLALVLGLAACTAEQPPAPTPIPNQDADTPPQIVAVRTAAVDYLREGARCFVPGRMSVYHPVTGGGYTVPAGYDVYRFQTESCMVTVTAQDPAPAEPLFHVTIGDDATGYCLQAIVSANGNVLHTGGAAAIADQPGNFAATYCAAQGYDYEIIEREDGSQCGACVFPDGSSCKAWDYFHGICAPGEGTFTGSQP